LNVELPPRFQALVREKVDSGQYDDASAVVRDALRLLEERHRRDRLKAALAVGVDDLNRGAVVDWTPDFMDRVKAEADEEDRLGLPIDDDVTP